MLIAAYTAEPGNVARVLARQAGMDETHQQILQRGGIVMAPCRRSSKTANSIILNQRFDGFAGKTILVADDDTYSGLVAKSYLERCGANVVEAEHGQAVLASCRKTTLSMPSSWI